MITEEIKNAELIANYMGYEKVRVGYLDSDSDEWRETDWQLQNLEWMEKVGLEDVGDYFVNVKEDKWVPVKMLQYDCFDQLMPVIEKIETGNYGFKLCRKRAEVFYDDTKEVIFSLKEKSRLESAYAAVVKFLTEVK